MTDKQQAFIRRLLDERDIPDELETRLLDRLDGDPIPVNQASDIIDWLLKQPYKEQPVRTDGLDLTGVPEGRYAVGDRFFKIDAPEAGKWAGWVFVKEGSQYKEPTRFGSQRPGNTYYGEHADLLATVVDNPVAAAQEYGRQTGNCAVCGRSLEDDVSVARGVGPVCWGRIGGDEQEEVA